MPFDLDAGLTIRRHQQSGMRIAMVKSDPGKFYFENGTRVTEELAEQAGFNVTFYRQQREKKELIDAATMKIAAQFDTPAGLIVAQTQSGAYQVKHTGGGVYNIVNQEGEQVTPKAFGESEAIAMIKVIANENDPFVDLRKDHSVKPGEKLGADTVMGHGGVLRSPGGRPMPPAAPEAE